MSEFKGTKGQWFFESGLGHATIYDDCDIDILDESDNTKEQVKANALLISKAPEMLEMLIKCERIISDLEIDTNDIQELIKSATEIK